MTTKMLIDAAHPEETRVVVTRGNRVEEFDFESASRRPLRGNIYLAKVTRVEPSLQAAFVDFGGNRHGFLAFAEIHPDYYQIPTADRQALLAEEAAAARAEDNEDEERAKRPSRRGARAKQAKRAEAVTAEAEPEAEASPSGAENPGEAAETAAHAGIVTVSADDPPAESTGETATAPPDAENAPGPDEDGEAGSAGGENAENGHGEDQVAEVGGGGDAMEEVPTRVSHRPRRQYKIQEVIKRRQILLVQVVKEERGNKGAALTTYLSLAGRYSVLMPNTARGGGISRKITSAADRKRLKTLAADLEVPEGMGVILRTAGASRTKVEIKRDFEYLMRLWESVRELTLQSTAPALVYEEGSLIKRAIRDLYSKDIEEIQVAGDDGYREAKDFMRMLMPSHAKAVQPYKDATPIFSRFGVESQLDAMFSNVVTLKSGGYIVINQTEALVSIDVNSGRSTREHNIEDTALKTNLEAAEEVSRQLRLRDLAGLIVIDFIDMEEKRNNKAVERKLADCLKNDRARIQVGRISHFGLLEMSRQRIRTGVLESSTTPCPHCGGTGLLRSTPSLALHVLRALEDTLLRSAAHDITLKTRLETAFYILNQKRDSLRALEARFGVTVTVIAESVLPPGQHFLIERGEPVQPRMIADRPEAEAQADAPARVQRPKASPHAIHPEDVEMGDLPEESEAEDEAENGEAETREEQNGEGRRRRRRRRRRGRDSDTGDFRDDDAQARGARAERDDQEKSDDEDEDGEGEDSSSEDRATREDTENGERKRRRRRRGGRRNRRDREPHAGATGEGGPGEEDEAPTEDAGPETLPPVIEPEIVEAPQSEPGPLRPVAVEPAPAEPAALVPPPPKPLPEPEPEIEDPNRPKRTGWWAKARQAISGD